MSDDTHLQVSLDDLKDDPDFLKEQVKILSEELRLAQEGTAQGRLLLLAAEQNEALEEEVEMWRRLAFTAQAKARHFRKLYAESRQSD